jgi:hypothetical protein
MQMKAGTVHNYSNLRKNNHKYRYVPTYTKLVLPRVEGKTHLDSATIIYKEVIQLISIPFIIESYQSHFQVNNLIYFCVY